MRTYVERIRLCLNVWPRRQHDATDLVCYLLVLMTANLITALEYMDA